MTVSAQYLLDSAAPGENQRLTDIGRAYDPGTRRLLLKAGVRAGARVLLAGVGAATFLPWLSQVVGGAGHILATDVDLRHAQPVAADLGNVTLLHHDFLKQPFPPGTFDVVHGRLILIHFPQRAQIVDRLVAALRPGGTLLVEDYDWGSYGPVGDSPEAAESRQLIARLADYYRGHGFDPYTGRALPGLLRRSGLTDVDAEGRVLTLRGAGSSLAGIYTGSHLQLTTRPDAHDLVSAEETERFLARMADPRFDMCGQTMMAAWGRRGEQAAG